jgi:hypothetical protein
MHAKTGTWWWPASPAVAMGIGRAFAFTPLLLMMLADQGSTWLRVSYWSALLITRLHAGALLCTVQRGCMRSIARPVSTPAAGVRIGSASTVVLTLGMALQIFAWAVCLWVAGVAS